MVRAVAADGVFALGAQTSWLRQCDVTASTASTTATSAIAAAVFVVGVGGV